MAMDLAKKTFSVSEEYFIAGTTIGITTAVKTAGAAAIAAHTPVILSEGKVTAIASKTALTGLYGITAEDVAANGEAIVYLTGEFFGDALALPSGCTAADVEVALRNIGIFLK